MLRTSRPVLGVIADVTDIKGMPYHTAQDKYLSALWHASEGMPVVIPAFGGRYDLDEIIAGVDGLLLTGCISNIEPWRYGGPIEPPCGPYDPARDETVLPLIPRALAAGLPILAVCRGFQELNVALGGSLHPRLHELPGRLDHRAPYGKPIPDLYAPAHAVRLVEGSQMARLAGGAAEIMVNSLHEQGIDRVAARLVVEGTAPDGTIEAVRVADAPGFALGVQWHPEWQVMENPVSLALFRAFGDAARAQHAGGAARAAA